MATSFNSLGGGHGNEPYYHYEAPCSGILFCCCPHPAHPNHASAGSRRGMGPFAESMGISTGMAMWIAVAQLPVMMGLALHYPTVRVDLFSTGEWVGYETCILLLCGFS